MTAPTLTSEPACWSWPVPDGIDGDRPWDALVAWQAGRCALCGRDDRALEKDHDHRTGLRRGQLCKSCNNHEGKCTRSPCACDGYRVRHPAAILGVEVEHGGWYATDHVTETDDEVSARVAKIRNRRSRLDEPSAVEIVEMPDGESAWALWSSSSDVDTGGCCTCGHEGLGPAWHLYGCPGAEYALRRKVRELFIELHDGDGRDHPMRGIGL